MNYPEKKALVLGAGGFIGNRMVTKLKEKGYWVRGADLKMPEFSKSKADEFVIENLTDITRVKKVLEFKGWQGNYYNEIPYKMIEPFDEIYQFAADMGGAGFVFTGENDADLMHNSVSVSYTHLTLPTKA